MNSKQSRDMSASVRARLMNVAKQNGEAFDLVLVRFAIERLLYRIDTTSFITTNLNQTPFKRKTEAIFSLQERPTQGRCFELRD
jgi:hypothetical protein